MIKYLSRGITEVFFDIEEVIRYVREKHERYITVDKVECNEQLEIIVEGQNLKFIDGIID